MGCFAENVQYLSEDILAEYNELVKRILPLAKGEGIQGFDVALSQIESIEEKASEVRARQSLLIENCQDLRENLTKIREGFCDE